MLVAVATALAVRADLCVRGVASEREVGRVVRAAGLDVWLGAPLVGRVLGFLHEDVVYVKAGLPAPLRRVVVAHEVMHHLNGDADGTYRLAGRRTPAEARAQVGAFALLLGRPGPTEADLTAQVHAGHAAGLPLEFLFTAASILSYRLDAVRGLPLLALS